MTGVCPWLDHRVDRVWGRIGGSMNLEVIGAAVAVVGALLWIRRDMRHDIAEVRRDLSTLRSDLTAQIAAVNTRIDNILPADPKPWPR